jgi:hypothetical protein
MKKGEWRGINKVEEGKMRGGGKRTTDGQSNQESKERTAVAKGRGGYYDSTMKGRKKAVGGERTAKSGRKWGGGKNQT